ncbi:unnamed protein product [Candida verbasci]|uniref:Phosphatase tensin-type domain-containing protein n=1 Tax=Candida verbasci TaxID=1227364 RepID=A0A9W4U166_9ASCO|nr:unnamed protein product [Candida verbasci]
MKMIKTLSRLIISSPKKCYYDSLTGLIYDLSFILPNLIVCSGPVTNSYFNSFFRYELNDLIKILSFNFGNQWHLFNFKGEDPGYLDSEVFGKVSHYPFPDHYPPTLKILKLAVLEIHKVIKSGRRCYFTLFEW